MKGNSAYIEIIGPENLNDDTLAKTSAKIKTCYKEIITSREDIKFDSIIYLIAHGDNPVVCGKVAFGNKTPEQVFNTIVEILKDGGFNNANNKGEFKGGIILEGCHSAEPVPDEKTRKKLRTKSASDNDFYNSKAFRVIKNECSSEKNSFLADLLELFHGKFHDNKIIAKEAEIGGYLGTAHDSGDYSISGYGKSGSDNPVTIRFQEKRGFKKESANDGIIYNENESYIEVRISAKNLDFGLAKNKDNRGENSRR